MRVSSINTITMVNSIATKLLNAPPSPAVAADTLMHVLNVPLSHLKNTT